MLSTEEEQKIVLAFSSMSSLVWGLTQVVCYQIQDDPVCADFVIAVKAAQDHMLGTLRNLGVNVEIFENHEIKVAARKHMNN